MALHVPTVPLQGPAGSSSTDYLASAIASACEGLLWVRGVPGLPVSEVSDVLSYLASDEGRQLGTRLNQAYTKNQVFKDSHADGKGGSTVDRKRVRPIISQILKYEV